MYVRKQIIAMEAEPRSPQRERCLATVVSISSYLFLNQNLHQTNLFV